MSKKIFDVIIIGGGIVGCSTAFKLATEDKTLKILLVEEQSKLFQGSTKAGFGSLTPFSDPYFCGEPMHFAAKGVEILKNEWIEQINSIAKLNFQLGNIGLLQLCNIQSKINYIHKHHNYLKENGYNSEVISSDDLFKMEPHLNRSIKSALWLNEPWIDLELYLKSIEICLNRFSNVKIIHNTKLNNYVINRNKPQIRINRDIFYSDKIILATGLSNSNYFNKITNIKLCWIRGDAIGINTKNQKPVIKHHLYMGNGFITPRNNGYMLLGATYFKESFRSDIYGNKLTNQIEVKQALTLFKENIKILPCITDCDLVKVWRGWRPSTSDKLPILGTLTRNTNWIIANGFIGLGITMAPAIAESISDYIIKNISSFPVSFNPNRFNEQISIQ